MNALKDYVNWKLTHADKTAEAEGYPLTMENCKKNKRMKQLEIYGDSVQDGTPTPENPIEVQSVGVKSVNLFDINTYPLTVGQWINGVNGSVSDKGYPANAYTKDYIPCTELRGKTLTLNHSFGANPGICFYDEEKVFLSGLKYNLKTVFTFTVPEDAVYYRFSTASEFVDEIQIQAGSTATPYEPYGKYKIPVVQRGINLFSMAKAGLEPQTINGITFTPLDDERIHIKGKAIDTSIVTRCVFYFQTKMPIKQGVYSVTPYAGVESIIFSVITLSGSFIANINSSSNNNVFTQDGFLDKFNIRILANNTKDWDDIVPIQLTQGKDLKYLPYEPYVEPVTTNIYLDEPLRKIGDYADYIDGKGSKVFRGIYRQIYTGEENWIKSGVFNNTDVFRLDNAVPYIGVHPLSIRSNYLVPRWQVEDNDWAVGEVRFQSQNYLQPTKRIYMSLGVSTVEELKEFLTTKYNEDNPLYLEYPMAEPTEEPITLDLPKLNAKTTIIEVDTSLAPSNSYGKYIKK